MTEKTRAAETGRLLLGGVAIEVERKDIRNLYLRLRADGSVRITAPRRTPEETIRRFAEAKELWLLRRREELARRGAPAAQSCEDGAELPLWGQWVPLRVRPAGGRRTEAVREDGAISLRVGRNDTEETRRAALARLYRRELEAAVPPLLRKYEARMGVRAAAWRLRDMRSRWGSCHVREGRITLNLRLAAYPPFCLEGVTAHELCHLLESGHNAAFYACLSRACPDWPAARERLRLAPAGEAPRAEDRRI